MRLLTSRLGFFVLCFLLLVFGPDVAAAEGEPPDWRDIYDLILMWINFGILVFLFFRFARKPLAEFITGRREAVGLEIRRLEEERKAVTDQIRETTRLTTESEDRFIQMKQRLITEGEKARTDAVESACQQGRYMMEAAKRKIDNRIRDAKNRLRAELVEMAVEQAETELKKRITEDDHARLINAFLTAADAGSSPPGK